MKNKYVTKMLCITLISAMVMSSSVGVFASVEETPAAEIIQQPEEPFVPEPEESAVPEPEEPSVPQPEEPSVPDPTEIPTPDPIETPTPDPTETPTPDPIETPTPDPTETPMPDPTETPTPDPTETPTPDPTETPTPDPTETPTPDPTEIPDENTIKVIDLIEELGKKDTLTKEELEKARKAYDALSDEEKKLVTNYDILKKAEEQFKEDNITVDDVDGGYEDGTSGSYDSSGYSAVEGAAVVYSGTAGVTNLHAGRSFYLDQLKDTYALSFDDEFEDVMDSIEKEYKQKNKISDDTEILVRNWQDILAVYVLKQTSADKKEIKLDKTSKAALADIFEEMNQVVRDKKNILKISYENLHVSDYAKNHKDELSKSDKALLNKYTSKDCALLCSTVTAAKGFIRESAGDDISEERVDVISAAYSLVGKVGYFWGGKSRVIGWDSSWGTAATVSAGGSSSSGTVRAYGLDCSGFVTWAFVNGYKDTEKGDAIGEGTSDQWEHCETINAQDAQPGDLVFQRGPEGGSNNHVGILVGQTDEGDWIAVHCSSGQNGVVVGEAYSASFRYIRCPSVFPTKEEVIAQREAKDQELMEQSLVLATEEKQKKTKKNLTGQVAVESSDETVAVE